MSIGKYDSQFVDEGGSMYGVPLATALRDSGQYCIITRNSTCIFLTKVCTFIAGYRYLYHSFPPSAII